MRIHDLFKFNTSYKAGLLQAKAFRILKKRTNDALKPYAISATDWGVLGVLLENPDGLSFKEIAAEVGVKAPFITRSIKELVRLGYVTVSPDVVDTRVKNAIITTAGKRFVKKVEPRVMKEVLAVFSGASKRNVLGYLMTLSAIIKNHPVDEIDSVDLDHMQFDE